MHMSTINMSDDSDWVVVKGRTERLRILQRQNDADEMVITEQKPEKINEKLEPELEGNTPTEVQNSNAYHSLVGAPIRRSMLHPAAPPSNTLPEITDKIGGVVHLATHGVPLQPPKLSSDTTTRSHQMLDLSDANEWPSVGLEGGVAPRLGSWSTVVKKPAPPVAVHRPRDNHQELGAEAELSLVEGEGESNRKKKKRKGREKAKAAVERDPLMLELAAVFQALELNQSKKVVVATGGGVALPKRPKVVGSLSVHGEEVSRSGNILDSSAPAQRRGKEREAPKKKRPSALRKVIIKEKMERQKDKELTAGVEELDQSETGGHSKEMHSEEPVTLASQKPVASVHNRKFREYCDHMITEGINQHVEKLLTDLRYFQDRQYLKDPTKSKAKRRYVCGLKEVCKHLKLKRIKCVIVPPNLDRIQSEGGINDFVEQILELCEEQGIQVVFASSRRRLALLLRKKHKIGCVGIFYYDGAEGHYKKLLELVEVARYEYSNKVTSEQSSNTSGASADLSISISQLCDSSAESSSEDFTESPEKQLNINADEFVPSNSLNVNAAVFTPSFMSL